MKTTATQEYCMDTLYTQSYQNGARNIEKTSTLSTYFLEYSTATMQRYEWHLQLLERIMYRHHMPSVIETGQGTLNIWALSIY